LSSPRISYVVPIHDEEAILHAAVADLRERLRPLGYDWELVLAENGSRDGTVRVCEDLAEKWPEVSWFSIDEPNYGRALREGIERARGELVICEEIDLCDVDFHQRAIAMLDRDEAELVVGSKLLEGARDQRPMFRHAASLAYSAMLRALFDFRGTDTHGLKAFRKSALVDVVQSCVVDRDVFASELVIRAYREGKRVREIPVRVMEKRPPSIGLLSRVPSVLRRVAELRRALERIER
jgi:glycosyltransferase involved in cell wall biosynthesis